MARCGCTATETCNCTVEAGTGVSVTGSGTPGNPYVVGIDTIDCSQIRPCISAGNGATYNSTSGIVQARLSPAAGNLVEFAPDGGLFVDTDCPQVRACLSEGQGIDYDPLTGVIAARPSTDGGNNLVFGGDGGLYVPAGAATVNTGCGISGDGSGGDPLAAAVGAWPYACDLEDNGGVVVCGNDGLLHGEPRGRALTSSFFFDQDFANVPVPAAPSTFVLRVENDFTNPDPCRPAVAMVIQELDVTLDFPAGSQAEYGFGGDEMVLYRNTGATAANDLHWQVTKVLGSGIVAAGATVSRGFDVLMGRGTGGSSYVHVQGILRILFVTA